MKIMYIQKRRYEIKDIGLGWFDLSCDGNLIAKLLGEEECRRVIWVYWNDLGVDMPYLTDDDFDEVENE